MSFFFGELAMVVAAAYPMFAPLYADRFRAKVRFGKPEECWPWLGAGSVAKGGRFFTREGPISAHRWLVSFLLGRRLAKGERIEHRCPEGRKDARCCNPAHLLAGLLSLPPGLEQIEFPGNKLDGTKAASILKEGKAFKQKVLAERHGVSQTLVSLLLAGKYGSLLFWCRLPSLPEGFFAGDGTERM